MTLMHVLPIQIRIPVDALPTAREPTTTRLQNLVRLNLRLHLQWCLYFCLCACQPLSARMSSYAYVSPSSGLV